jgi:hypothetical protein
MRGLLLILPALLLPLSVLAGSGPALPVTAAIPVEVLRSTGGLPAHLAGAFDEISACHLTREGNYVIFDRPAHAVYAAEPSAATPRKILQIGAEPGRLLRPLAFDSSSDDTFVVADSPEGRSRLQFFLYSGGGFAGFTIAGPETLSIRLGDTIVSGIGSLEYTGSSVLISLPQNGQLVTEFATDGRIIRTFGDLRPTGHEHDPDVHAALNVGRPLADPRGGFYYVFLSGVPMFRKYDAKGELVFERHIQGVEMDPLVQALPTSWQRQKGHLPLVPVSVRAAAVDRGGRLWISLAVPYTYIYDPDGDKVRTLQFRAAGIMSPSGLFFTRDGRVLATPGCYAFPAG